MLKLVREIFDRTHFERLPREDDDLMFEVQHKKYLFALGRWGNTFVEATHNFPSRMFAHIYWYKVD